MRALHLLAIAAWLGGLLWLRRARSLRAPPRSSGTQRVSSVALSAVIVVAFSGVVQTRLFFPASGATRPVRRTALIVAGKLAGVGVLVLFGAYHRFASCRSSAKRGRGWLRAARCAARSRDVARHPRRRAARVHPSTAALTSDPFLRSDADRTARRHRPHARPPSDRGGVAPRRRRRARASAPAIAHVTVWPRSAAPGAFERYVVRVPNEKNTRRRASRSTSPPRCASRRSSGGRRLAAPGAHRFGRQDHRCGLDRIAAGEALRRVSVHRRNPRKGSASSSPRPRRTKGERWCSGRAPRLEDPGLGDDAHRAPRRWLGHECRRRGSSTLLYVSLAALGARARQPRPVTAPPRASPA